MVKAPVEKELWVWGEGDLDGVVDTHLVLLYALLSSASMTRLASS